MSQVGRKLPFPLLEEWKQYLRSLQAAYGIRFYTIRCVPTGPPTVTEVHGTITLQARIPILYIPSPPLYYYKYRYTIAGDDAQTYMYETSSPRFIVGDRVILTVRDGVVQAMRKEGETKALAAIMGRPRLLGNFFNSFSQMYNK